MFSAVLTAFNAQSYQLLQPEPTDAMTAVLQRISAQLDSFSVNGRFVNATQQSRPLDELQPSFRAPPSAVWVNALWFSSLVCSLASASIALMVKQWLHELAIGVSGRERESARRRQYRLNGIAKWRIRTVVVVIPIVLQLALFLFLAGLVVLLWTLHVTVAAVASYLIAVLFIYQFSVTVLPSIQWDCCYLSPQALMVYSVVRPIHNAMRTFLIHISWLWARAEPPSFWNNNASELTVFRSIKKRLIRGCNQIQEMPPWRGDEQSAIGSLAPSSVLDRCTAVMACTTTFSSKHLDDIQALLSGLSPKDVALYLEDVWALYQRRRVEGLTSFKILKSLTRLLLCSLRHMLTVAPEARDEEWERTVKAIVDRHSPLMADHVAETDLFLTTFSILATDRSVAANVALSKVRHQISLHWSCSYSSIRHGKFWHRRLHVSAADQVVTSHDHGRAPDAASSESRRGPRGFPVHLPPGFPDRRAVPPVHFLQ